MAGGHIHGQDLAPVPIHHGGVPIRILQGDGPAPILPRQDHPKQDLQRSAQGELK